VKTVAGDSVEHLSTQPPMPVCSSIWSGHWHCSKGVWNLPKLAMGAFSLRVLGENAFPELMDSPVRSRMGRPRIQRHRLGEFTLAAIFVFRRRGLPPA